jgi:zinc transport system substrate-binding protein
MLKFFILLCLPLLAFSRLHITVNFPLEEFLVKKIGQNNVRIKTITNKYKENILEFRKSEYKKFSNANIYFYFDLKSGREYADKLKQYNKDIVLVNLSSNIKKLKLNNKLNPYIWMDPIRVRVIVKDIYKVLSTIDKRNKNFYKMQLEDFLNEIDELFLKTKRKLFESENYNFFVYDEYWQYYAKRFRLNLYSKDKRHLRAHEIKDINSQVKKYNINSLVISPDTNNSIAQSISGNTNIKIKKHDIFESVWFYNINQLTSIIAK